MAPNVGLGKVQVIVTNTVLGNSIPFPVTVYNVQPAFFQWGNNVVATKTDYSLAVKNGTFPGVTTTPAKFGDIIILWGTGFGPTSPSVPEGIIVPTNAIYYTSNTVTVTLGNTFGNIPAKVLYTVLTPGSAGLYQVAIQIPNNLPNGDGDYSIIATVAGVSSPLDVLLTVTVK
jgi:uncharacterized protein (TIGR03437 family)